MAISMKPSGRTSMSDPNVTPMIDVLLVLLITFIVAQQLFQKTIDVQLPRDGIDGSPNQIVLQIEAGGVYSINRQRVAKTELAARLAGIYRNRPQKVIFVKAEPDVVYQDVIEAADMARGAGVKVIGAVLAQ